MTEPAVAVEARRALAEAEHPVGRRVALEPVGAVVAVVLALASAVAVAAALRTAGEPRRGVLGRFLFVVLFSPSLASFDPWSFY